MHNSTRISLVGLEGRTSILVYMYCILLVFSGFRRAYFYTCVHVLYIACL